MKKYSRENIQTVLKMAWPSVLESFFVALVGMVDSLMVSRVGAHAVAAVGLTTQPKFIGLAVFIAVNVSVSALVARRKGQENQKGANEVLCAACFFVLIMSVIVSLACVIFADPIIRMCGSEEASHTEAVQYFRIIMGFIIFTVISLTVNAAQRGAGNTKIAMKTNVAANVVNVIFNYLLIEGHFGFPALGVSGAAIAIQHGTGGINGAEWVKVLYGLVLSLVLGFGTGWVVCKIISFICRDMDRRRTNRFFGFAQIAGAAAMSFMHGAQDGQKFIGVLFLGAAFAHGQNSVSGMEIPVWLMLLCSVVMALGTSVGGEKIIKSVGMDMVKLERYQGFAADVSGALCLLYSSLFGIPVSTTHTKTSAIMGVGAVKRISAINFGVVKDMVLTWIFTFPGCGLISFIMAKIFMYIF